MRSGLSVTLVDVFIDGDVTHLWSTKGGGTTPVKWE